MRDRNFATCCIIIFCAFAVLYGASTSLPGLLQSLFGYDALSAGLVMSPAGLFALLAMPVVGFLLGRGSDARWLIAAGLLVMAAGNYWMSQLNLDISPGQVVWPRVVTRRSACRCCFAPLNVAAYLYTPQELRGAAVGLLSLLRNEGGSVGTSMAQTLPGAPRSVPHAAARRVSRSLQPGRELLHRAGAGAASQQTAIRPPRSSWPGRRSRTCASSRPPRLPISTASGSSPW